MKGKIAPNFASAPGVLVSADFVLIRYWGEVFSGSIGFHLVAKRGPLAEAVSRISDFRESYPDGYISYLASSPVRPVCFIVFLMEEDILALLRSKGIEVEFANEL